VDVDLDDKKILEGMLRVVLTSDDMVESIFQGNGLHTALDLDPAATLVSTWAEPFHKTTDLTENDCLWKDLENTHFSSETESSADAHMRTCQPAPPSSSSSYKYGGSTLLQPETRPIGRERLVVEIEWIYVGPVMVEMNFINIGKLYDPFPFMNEKCFSADCPCWRYSSIPAKRLRGGWIGTQLPTQLPTQLYSYIRKRHELTVYVFYLEAYD
jgi:hypothetical protein